MKSITIIKENLPVTIFAISLGLFVLSQLISNSQLAPLGIELQNLNSEKNYLVEENREMEEQIAKYNSIVAIKKLADKTLSLSSSNKKTVIYLEDSNLVANR